MAHGARTLCIVAVSLALASTGAQSRCKPDGPNAAAAAVMRADVLTNCACCDLGSARAVKRCVRPRLKAAVHDGRLPRACARRLLREQRRRCRRTDCATDQLATTTTMPEGVACTRDEECDDANPCTSNWCAAGSCRYACDRCGIAHPDKGFEWVCCSPPRDDCPPLPPTTTSTTLPGTCEPGRCRYYRSCGEPICPAEDPVLDVPPCTTQVEEAPCSTLLDACDAGFPCGAVLVCIDRDPVAGHCPISLRDAKRDIRYLDATELERLRDDLLHMKLARWRYRADTDGGRERLGFIIDDVVGGGTCRADDFAVAGDGSHVDLYGYASLAVAAIQAQARQIDALEREIAALRAEMAAGRSAPTSPP